MKTPGWITFFYGLLVLVGGIIGHVKAASTASLVMGSLFGVLLLSAAVGMLKDRLFPAYFGILLIFLLTAFFTYRWLYTFAFFPAGIMCLISAGVFVAVALMIRNHLRDQRNQ